LRHELSQLRLMGEVPRIHFVKDKVYSKAAEVDILLAKADYGEDFVPSDPTLFQKSDPRLEVKLSDGLRSKILELERNTPLDEDDDEPDLPEMRHDVMGLDHSMIMKKIATSIDKSKKAWETFDAQSESFITNQTSTEGFVAAQAEISKMNREAEIRNDFVKFLERKQIPKRDYERKNRKNLKFLDDEEAAYEQRDPIPDDDFIIEDDNDKKVK
jgi:hypothetical protein